MVSVLLALGAAAVFGLGTALQHRAAYGVSRTDVASGRLLPRLLRRPGWVVGLVCSAGAFTLHVAALQRGSLTLVQPIVVTTPVFAVVARSGLDRRWPDPAETVWAMCTWVGLIFFITTVGTDHAPHAANDQTVTWFLIIGTVTAALTGWAARRVRVATYEGFLWGVAAGILYGLTAGLVKVAASHASLGVVALMGHWSAWLVAPAGVGAFMLSQRAYHATRLSVTAPVLNIVDVLVAVTFGSVVFGDHLFDPASHRVVELLGAALIGVGVWRLIQADARHRQGPTSVGSLGRIESPRDGTDRRAS